MKRLTTIFSLLVLMLGLSQYAKAQTWDFTQGLSTADKALLDADNTNWYNDADNGRYNYLPALDNEAVKAGGTELAYTKGLKFKAGAAAASSNGSTPAEKNGKIRPSYASGKVYLNINGNNVVITVPSLTAGLKVEVTYKSSSSSTARTLTPTNLKETTNFEATTEQVTGSGIVEADGDVTLTTTGGLYIYSIKVTDPSQGGGGGGGDTPGTEDYSTTSNLAKNQAILTLSDNTKKYYNTESLTDLSFEGKDVTVNLKNQSAYTFQANVTGIAFRKADNSSSGEIHNTTNGVQITEAKGWLESAYVKFDKLDGAKTYNVYIKGGQYADYTKIDEQLVRDYGTYGRADVVGLQSADYAIKVVPVDADKNELADKASEATKMIVKNYSRQGFAFMNGYAPGAYKTDGTLKAKAKVFYVTKNTAKTITTDVITDNKGGTTACTGIQTIIDAYQKGYDTTPIAFRLIGLVEKDDLDAISSSEEGIQIKGKNKDSEMNITIEGIGDDATIRGFGFLVRNSKSVEFRNFAIMRCMDDGISLDTDNSNIWIHHTDQFYGKHGSGDHAKGDGAVDVKSDSKYVTVSYNRFWDTGKSNMFGMKSESGPNYISYDHNWFDHSDSRHPRVRTMSVHVWNNYFDNVAKYGVGATTGASVFVENNYFLKTKKPILASLQGTDGLGSGTFSGEDGGMIKAFGNYFDKNAAHFSYYTQQNPSSKGYDAYETSTRNETVPETEVTLAGGNKYNNFDTNATLMYEYTPEAADEVPGVVTGYYGAGRLNHGDFSYTFKDNVGSDDDDSAYDSTLGGLLDNYKSSLVGIFGEENAGGGTGGGDEPGGGDNPGGDTEGTIMCSFNGSVSNSLFTAAANYGDGKITYKDVYYKQGEKMDSKGSITFTPTKNYNMKIVLATAKSGRDVKLNGTTTTVSGTENTEGKYYELQPIPVTANTAYEIKKGSAEAIVMLIILEPVAE